VRNTAFVVVGLLFLIVQANVYRLIQVVAAIGDSISGRLAAWGFESAVPVVKGMTWLVTTPNLLLPLIVFTGVHESSPLPPSASSRSPASRSSCSRARRACVSRRRRC
jgi:hypothetical protein